MAELSKTKDRRAAIVDVAARLFAEQGYAATSMSMIAARLGGSKATLYSYFKSKESIFEAHIQAQCAKVSRATFDEWPEDSVGIAAILRSVGAHLVELILSDAHIANLRMLVAESQRTPELGRIFYQAGPLNGERRLARYLEAAVERGELVPLDSTTAARQFLSLCRSRLFMERLIGLSPAPTAAEADACAAEAVTAFMAAYAPR